MSNVYVMSDPHWGHEGVRKFSPRKERCEGMSMLDHDQWLIERWNAIVTKRDVVYLLGDIGKDKEGYVTYEIVPQLTGRIIVVGGNHDTPEILTNFDKVNGVIVKTVNKYHVVMTHIPIHPQEFYRWDYNMHGHLHGGVIIGKGDQPDERYINVCCEHTNYQPIRLDSLVPKDRI